MTIILVHVDDSSVAHSLISDYSTTTTSFHKVKN